MADLLVLIHSTTSYASGWNTAE